MHKRIQKVSIDFSLTSLAKELARKFIHVGACGTALFLIGHDLIVLELLFLPVMALGFYISERVDVLGKTLSFGSRRKWGGILLAFGLSIVMLMPVEYELKKFAILTLMIADVMAAIIGKIVPLRKVEVLGAFKSIGGSLAFAIGVIIALTLSFDSWQTNWQLKVLVTILTLEFFEFLNWRGIDNLTLPFAALTLGSILWI
jgi:dolichol kinase